MSNQPKPSLIIRRVETEVLLNDYELSKAFNCLHNGHQPRLKKLKEMKSEEWSFLAQLLSKEMLLVDEAKKLDRIH